MVKGDKGLSLRVIVMGYIAGRVEREIWDIELCCGGRDWRGKIRDVHDIPFFNRTSE